MNKMIRNAHEYFLFDCPDKLFKVQIRAELIEKLNKSQLGYNSMKPDFIWNVDCVLIELLLIHSGTIIES